MDIQKGYLVRHRGTGRVGIITAVGREKAMVFWGDGLESEADRPLLAPVRFHTGSSIAADFIELVEAREQVRGRRTVYPSV